MNERALLLTVAEVAELLRHPDPASRAAAEMVRRHKVPGRIPGRRPMVFARHAVEDWLADQPSAQPTSRTPTRSGRRKSSLTIAAKVATMRCAR